jgi:LysM repeat protein
VRRYLGPAAFLLVATVAVLLVRSGLRSGHHSPHASSPPPVTTTVAHTATVAKRYWIVRAGDTFGVIAARTGVPLATLQKLNPNVQPTALFIGQRIRLR